MAAMFMFNTRALGVILRLPLFHSEVSRAKRPSSDPSLHRSNTNQLCGWMCQFIILSLERLERIPKAGLCKRKRKHEFRVVVRNAAT
ncbi:hypothetical protein BDQ17DRAFT_1370974 [Cyathus striatus]|nr:hypothetical protein BDQ17DRAFT_1370974 [Cyathus striatus]